MTDPRSAQPDRPQGRPAGIRVVYAEDNPQDAELTRARFADVAPECEVEIVDSGQRCLERLGAGGVDVLLLDHRLPDMDGLDVLKTLFHGGIPVPVVMVTAMGDEQLVVKALRLGAVNYVPKVGNYLATLPAMVRGVVEDYRRAQRLGLAAPPVARRILYIEHQRMDVELTLRHFAEAAPQFAVDVIASCGEALLRLEHSPAYDLLLIDLRMPDQNALEFIREAEYRGLWLPPFIVISGQGDDGAAIATLRLGAADYVAKREGYLDQLPYTIEHAIAHDLLRKLNEQLRVELSERARAEESLRESESRFRATFEQAAVGIAHVSPDGRWLRVNQKLCDILGYSRDELLTKTFQDITFPEDLAQDLRGLQLLLSGDAATYVREKRYVRNGGSLVWADLTVSLVREPSGEPGYFISVVEDISRRKEADVAHAKLEAQLLQAQKMESVGRLAGGVAHDFNNMLTIVRGYADMVTEKLAPDDPIRADIEEIRVAGDRSAALVQQLLAFARKQTIAPRVLDFNETLGGTLKMIGRLIGEDIELAWLPGRDVGLVNMDPVQIHQIVVNLAVNARDAIAGNGRISVETAVTEMTEEQCASHVGLGPGPFVMLSVSDTGCGMNAETLARIFDPFFTTKPQGEGTGLGLATVYGIVTQNRGLINVYSEPGRGTTFRIYLPRHHGIAAEARGASSGMPAVGTETVLLVEDDEALLKLARRMLEKLGYRVLAAENPAEALQVVDSHAGRIDLVMTDVIMPGMTGRALWEQLRGLRPELKCLFVSGYTADVIAHQGVLGPGVHFLGKPFSSEALSRKVRETLDA